MYLSSYIKKDSCCARGRSKSVRCLFVSRLSGANARWRIEHCVWHVPFEHCSEFSHRSLELFLCPCFVIADDAVCYLEVTEQCFHIEGDNIWNAMSDRVWKDECLSVETCVKTSTMSYQHRLVCSIHCNLLGQTVQQHS